MLKEYKEFMTEQWGSAVKAYTEVIQSGVNINTVENQQAFASIQAEALKEYGDLLEAKEKELSEALAQIIIEYSAKIAAVRSILRTIGREEEQRAGIKRELSGSEAQK